MNANSRFIMTAGIIFYILYLFNNTFNSPDCIASIERYVVRNNELVRMWKEEVMA